MPNTRHEFLELLERALRIVRVPYPEAELYEAEGTSDSGNPTENWHDIGTWKFIFRVNSIEGEMTASVKTVKPWGDLTQPELGEAYADYVIPRPLAMDITRADELLKETYTGPYKSVTLRHPVSKGDCEPHYIFSTPSPEKEGWYFVGVYDDKVDHVRH
ncbi:MULTISPECIES: hypothetical protein [Streptomyces]|uniref:Uncharacterized protein n=1 Tax=Streptomyces ramulosus TaxID=47762 RepID=A0ABW1FNZ0_9ACTN